MAAETLLWVVGVLHQVIRPIMLNPTLEQGEGHQAGTAGVDLREQDFQMQELQGEITATGLTGLHLLVKEIIIIILTTCLDHLLNQGVHQESEVV